MNARAAALELRGLTVPVAGRDVVRSVDVSVRPGELLALVGPSGCGKSTLLRAVAGLTPVSGGSVVLDGEVVDHLPPERRRVGLVFQDHALFPHLTVARNIAFGLRGKGRGERAARVRELLDLVRLPHAAHRHPHQLSGGEQQRVALARALAPSPAVVLLDEPFASLDAALRDELRADVVGMLRAAGATAVLVTHDRDEALSIGDRVAVMRDGVVEQVDEPAVVFHRPASRFVGSFLGPASFLTVERDGHGWVSPLGPVAVDGSAGPGAVGATVMVRPHDLAVDPGGDGVVTARRFTPAGHRYDVRLADGSSVQVDGGHTEPLHEGAGCTVRVVAGHRLVVVP